MRRACRCVPNLRWTTAGWVRRSRRRGVHHRRRITDIAGTGVVMAQTFPWRPNALRPARRAGSLGGAGFRVTNLATRCRAVQHVRRAGRGPEVNKVPGVVAVRDLAGSWPWPVMGICRPFTTCRIRHWPCLTAEIVVHSTWVRDSASSDYVTAQLAPRHLAAAAIAASVGSKRK